MSSPAVPAAAAAAAAPVKSSSAWNIAPKATTLISNLTSFATFNSQPSAVKIIARVAAVFFIGVKVATAYALPYTASIPSIIQPIIGGVLLVGYLSQIAMKAAAMMNSSKVV